MRTAIRVFSLTVAALSITSGCSHSECDRECLKGFMTAYLDALIARKPQDAPVSDHMRHTENTVDIQLGEGIWKTATKPTNYRQDILDPQWGVAGTHSH